MTLTGQLAEALRRFAVLNSPYLYSTRAITIAVTAGDLRAAHDALAAYKASKSEMTMAEPKVAAAASEERDADMRSDGTRRPSRRPAKG